MLYTSIQFSVILFRPEYRVREVPEKPDLSELPDTHPTALLSGGDEHIKLIKFVWLNNSAGSILIVKVYIQRLNGTSPLF